MAYQLSELAERLGAELHGDANATVERVAPLDRADEGCIAFYNDRKYRDALTQTGAAAVILGPDDLPLCPVAALVSDNPTLTFAHAARLIHPSPSVVGGCHPSAVVEASAQVDPSAWIGPTTVIEAGARIGERVHLGPGCIVGRGCEIGADSRLVARVTLCEGTRIGRRVLIHPGAVIGREGFGFAQDGERWVRVPQLGGVRLEDDVEVGANTTVDRGTLGDTVISAGAKLDNLIQIGHNCHIGENTAMAACAGISGSTRIGRNCTIGGAVGMAGHLTIADNVHFTGMAMVTRSFAEAGVYSGGLPATRSAVWRRTVARLRHLDELAQRIKRLEEQIAAAGDLPQSDPDA